MLFVMGATYHLVSQIIRANATTIANFFLVLMLILNSGYGAL